MSVYGNGKRPDLVGRLKSPFSHESLLHHLFDDLTASGLPLSQADHATMARRFSGEGLKFCYRTMGEIPTFLLHTLEYGSFPTQRDFSTLSGSAIPNFLGGLWRGIVDDTGSMLPDEYAGNATQNVAALLQVGSAFSKYADAFPKELVPQYLDDFVSTDRALASIVLPRALLSVARSIVTTTLNPMNLGDIVPKHGPGAVATGEKGEQKWEFKRLYNSAHQAYPYYKYMMVGGVGELLDRVRWYRGLERVPTGTAKVLIVPKTAKSLRVISMEPLELQFLQQGIMAKLVGYLQRHPFTKGHINFDDQTVNRNLALVNSRTKEMATIDLSSASDRLSLKLVKDLFSGVEDNVLRYLLATRSTHTVLPDGRTVDLMKFAPMGSATCFPVQSICFFALCVAAISIATNTTWSDVVDQVYVYGDDIVVPSRHLGCVADALESVGLVVNRNKSFSRGLFRESCGMFAFNGVDVTPIRFKTAFPHSRGDGRGIAAWIAYAHALESKGLTRSAEYVYTTIEELIGVLPYGLSGCGYFCRLAHSVTELAIKNSRWPFVRWNDAWQRVEIRTLGLSSRKRDVEFGTGWQRLLRDLITSYVDQDPSKAVVVNSAKPKVAWHALL